MPYTYRTVKGSPLTHAEYDENFYTVDSQYTAALEAAELAEKWASEAEDIEVVTGGYSALHWAAKAAASVGSITDEVAQAEAARDAAEGYATDAQTYAGQAMGYRDQAEGHKDDALLYSNNSATSADLAEDWATQPEDTEVTPGNYSALHWAAKADADAVVALSAKTDAEIAKDAAVAHSGYAGDYMIAAQGYKNDAEDARDLAQDWAEQPEDVEVTTGAYSALHHAAKSAASAVTADGKATIATAAANAAGVHKLKAQDWAEEDEDVEVETGLYSSKHHAAKSAASAVVAEGHADDAASSAAIAESEVTDALNPIQSYTETLATATWNSTSRTINFANGNVHHITLSGVNISTLTFQGVAASNAQSLTLVITQDSTVRSITWPGSVKWAGGASPSLSIANAVYVLTFLTVDGGTTWLGFEAGEFT